MSNQKIELVDWETIRRECKYSITDNNDDFSYGVHFIDDEGDVIDAQWFKTTDERNTFINENNLDIVDYY